jgi:multiple sugar transport system permease protein
MILSRKWVLTGRIMLILAMILTIIPFIYTLLISIKKPIDIYTGAAIFTPWFENYNRLFFSKQSNFMLNTSNSFISATATTILVLVIAMLGGYSLERFRWPRAFTGILAGWILLFHMIPGVTLVGPIYMLFRQLGLYDTLWSVILSHTVINLPLAIWIIQSFIADLPIEMEEAAHIDGSSNIQTFIQVVLPLIAPGLAAIAILTFVFSWNEFLFALNVTISKAVTIPIGIANFSQQYEVRYGEMAAAAFFATIPAIIFLSIAQRQIVKGLTLGALK